MTLRTLVLGSKCPRCGEPSGTATSASDRWCQECAEKRRRYRLLVLEDHAEYTLGTPGDVLDRYVNEALVKRGYSPDYGFTAEGSVKARGMNSEAW